MMLLIRPLIRANDNRVTEAHVIVFFIFIVSNAGGSLTPAEIRRCSWDFTRGVDFFWTVSHIFPETLFLVGMLLAIFYRTNTWYFTGVKGVPIDPAPDTRARIRFERRYQLLLAVDHWRWCCSVGSGEIGRGVQRGGAPVALPGLVRDIGLIAVTWSRCASRRTRCTKQSVFHRHRWRGGETLRRHFPDHHSGDRRHAQGRHRRPVRGCHPGRDPARRATDQ